LQACSFEFLAEESAGQHLPVTAYSFHNSLLGRVEPRPVHQRKGVVQILRGCYPPNEAEPGQGVRILEDGNSIGGDCDESEGWERSFAGPWIDPCLFDGLLAFRGEDQQITGAQQRKHLVVLETCDGHSAPSVEAGDGLVTL
jgi:hypothetical protein